MPVHINSRAFSFATTVFHRRLIAAKMNSVHSSIAASQGHRSLARVSQSQLETNLYWFIPIDSVCCIIELLFFFLFCTAFDLDSYNYFLFICIVLLRIIL
jgi:hypothetical protein